MLAAVLLLAALPTTRPVAQPSQGPSAVAPDTGLVIEVNEGMELLQVMGWPAQRYPTPPDSRYKTDAWAQFGCVRGDPARAPLRTAPVYSDVTELGLWLTRFPHPVVCLPDSSSSYASLERARVAAAMDEEPQRQASRGFVWVPLLADVIRQDYVPNRSAFPTFDAFADRPLQALATRRDAAEARVTTAQTPAAAPAP